MRTIHTYLIFCIGFAVCALNYHRQADGQISQALKDFKFDRPFQYAPSDPWTRSKLFSAHTKHRGLGYNCDGEECKRNSPYIHWKNHTENDLPARKGWSQRLRQTTAEVKQRIADGNCAQPSEATTCVDCQPQNHRGCTDCQSSNWTPTATHAQSSGATQKSIAALPGSPVITTIEKLETVVDRLAPPVPPSPRTAGLESLDIRR